MLAEIEAVLLAHIPWILPACFYVSGLITIPIIMDKEAFLYAHSPVWETIVLVLLYFLWPIFPVVYWGLILVHCIIEWVQKLIKLANGTHEGPSSF